MSVFAHPDDETIVSGGTLAACASAGTEVFIISLTRGELGPIARPELAKRDNLGSVRDAELHEAGRVLGASAVECMGFQDGALAWADASAVVDRLSELIGRWKPDIFITFGPEGLYWHPDHIAAHSLSIRALDSAGADGCSPSLYYATWPEGLARSMVEAFESRGLPSSLWGLSPDSFGVPPEAITTALDVRDFLNTKLRSLACHQTQLVAGNPLRDMPPDLSEKFLGTEYFALARSPAGRGDLLSEIVRAASLKGKESVCS